MIWYAKLQLGFHIELLQQEIKALLQQGSWLPHYNKAHYDGDWTVLPLRSPGGDINVPFAESMNGNTFTNTPLLDSLPETCRSMDALHCEKLSVRLLNLKAGSIIKQHRDVELAFEKGEARLHIPIFTNPKVEFYIKEDLLRMQAGECWYINANLPHRVANYGDTDRIHLVIDCKVNNWLTKVFEQSEKKSQKEPIDKHQQLQMIQMLKAQATATSLALADKLEKELNDEYIAE